MAVFTSWRRCIAQRWFTRLAPSNSIHGHDTKLVIHVWGQGQKGCGVIPRDLGQLLPPPRLPLALFILYNGLCGGEKTRQRKTGSTRMNCL